MDIFSDIAYELWYSILESLDIESIRALSIVNKSAYNLFGEFVKVLKHLCVYVDSNDDPMYLPICAYLSNYSKFIKTDITIDELTGLGGSLNLINIYLRNYVISSDIDPYIASINDEDTTKLPIENNNTIRSHYLSLVLELMLVLRNIPCYNLSNLNTFNYNMILDTKELVRYCMTDNINVDVDQYLNLLVTLITQNKNNTSFDDRDTDELLFHNHGLLTLYPNNPIRNGINIPILLTSILMSRTYNHNNSNRICNLSKFIKYTTFPSNLIIKSLEWIIYNEKSIFGTLSRINTALIDEDVIYELLNTYINSIPKTVDLDDRFKNIHRLYEFYQYKRQGRLQYFNLHPKYERLFDMCDSNVIWCYFISKTVNHDDKELRYHEYVIDEIGSVNRVYEMIDDLIKEIKYMDFITYDKYDAGYVRLIQLRTKDIIHMDKRIVNDALHSFHKSVHHIYHKLIDQIYNKSIGKKSKVQSTLTRSSISTIYRRLSDIFDIHQNPVFYNYMMRIYAFIIEHSDNQYNGQYHNNTIHSCNPVMFDSNNILLNYDYATMYLYGLQKSSAMDKNIVAYGRNIGQRTLNIYRSGNDCGNLELIYKQIDVYVKYKYHLLSTIEHGSVIELLFDFLNKTNQKITKKINMYLMTMIIDYIYLYSYSDPKLQYLNVLDESFMESHWVKHILIMFKYLIKSDEASAKLDPIISTYFNSLSRYINIKVPDLDAFENKIKYLLSETLKDTSNLELLAQASTIVSKKITALIDDYGGFILFIVIQYFHELDIESQIRIDRQLRRILGTNINELRSVFKYTKIEYL